MAARTLPDTEREQTTISKPKLQFREHTCVKQTTVKETVRLTDLPPTCC